MQVDNAFHGRLAVSAGEPMIGATSAVLLPALVCLARARVDAPVASGGGRA